MITFDYRDRSVCDLPRWMVQHPWLDDGTGMPLDLGVLNSVVRITSAGDLAGTGSIISVESKSVPGLRWPYIVTAHHVIKNQVEIGLEVPDPLEHGVMFPSIPSDAFRQPIAKCDLAIAPFPQALVPRYQAVHFSEHFVPAGAVVPLGGQIYYVGVFAPLNVPMCRPANLGALDIPISDGEYEYRADLVDFRSYNGFSGSPCFSTISYAVLDEPIEALPEVGLQRPDGTNPKLGRMMHLSAFCGMVTAHYSDEGAAGGVISRYGVGLMLPSDGVGAALMSPDAVEERRLADEKYQADKADSMPPLERLGVREVVTSDEFQRFEDLTRKLVQVPKSEIDEKRQ